MSILVLAIIIIVILILAGVAYKVNHSIPGHPFVWAIDLIIYIVAALLICGALLDFAGVSNNLGLRLR